MIKIILSLLMSAVCLYFATRNVHWHQLKTIIAGATILPVFLGVFVSFVTFWLRAVRWRILLKPFQEVRTVILLRWQVGALLVNNLMPLRIGELVRAYWAGHKTSVSKSTCLATIVVERIMDMTSIGLLGIIILFSMGFYKLNGFFTARNTSILILLPVLLILTIWFFIKRMDGRAFFGKLKNRLPEKAVSTLDKFCEGLKVFQNKNEIVKVYILSLVIWSIDIAIIQIISRTLALNLSWPQAGMVVVGLILGVMVPAAPGAAGTYEAGGVAALVLMGFDNTLALSFILLLHTYQYIYVLIIGIPTLAMEGFSPKKILEELKSQ